MKPIDRVLSRLDSVAGDGPAYRARCPAHDDNKPSLSITETREGRVLITCHAGCETETVVGAVGLSMADLFAVAPRTNGRAQRCIIETYDYTDEAGTRLFQAVRFEPKGFRQRRYDPAHPKANADGWVWSLSGVRRVLYRLPKLVEAAQAGGVVYVVEGEKDVHALERLGLVATCNPMGAGKWRREYAGSLRGAHVVILPDNDEAGRVHADAVASSLHGTAESVRLVELPGLAEKGDVSDWLRAGGTAGDLHALVEGAEPYVPQATLGDEASPEESTGEKRTQAQKLVEIAERAVLFHTPAGEAYAAFPVDAHSETAPVDSRTFGLWLRRLYYERHGRPPSTQALSEARAVIEARALFDGTSHPVYLRTAPCEGRIYVDLCNNRWEAVEITPEGWTLVTEPPVRFVRRAGMKPLPAPARGGSLADLLPFVRLARPEHAVLLFAWLVHALRPDAPQPVLVLTGEQGTGKSTVSKILRDLTDPSVSPVRSEPRNEHDLVISAENGWVQVFENLSRVSPWLSDALCRLATGAGFATRKLYSGREEELFYARRPIILNGIDDLTTRPDLADRAVPLFLERIPDRERMEERVLWPAFEAVRPGILGAIFDAMATALRRLTKTQPDGLPRMADFGRWALAAEPAIPEDCSGFTAEYARALRQTEEATIERDEVAVAIVRMLEKDGPWIGSMSDLKERLLSFVPNGGKRRPRDWPRNGRAMSARLRRLAPALRAVGISVEERGKDPVTRRMQHAIEYARSESFERFEASKTALAVPTASFSGEGWAEGSAEPEASDATLSFEMLRSEIGPDDRKNGDPEGSKDSKHCDAMLSTGTVVRHRIDGWEGTVTVERNGSAVGVMPFEETTSKMVPAADLDRLF